MGTAEPFRTLGFAGISWIEHFLVHGPGDVQGGRVELDDEFAAFLLKAYSVDARGERKVRRAFLSRSKGRSKSGFAAMIECLEALGPARFDHWAESGEVSDWGYEFEPGEPVGKPLTYVEILNVATEESQAGNTYDAVYFMLHPETCSPDLLDAYGKLDVGLTRINLPDRRGFIEPVTASNESKDGGKSTFIVADETHLWIPPAAGKFKLGKMHQTMVRNLLKRKQASGWMLETSTMYAAGEGSVAEGTHAYAKALGRSDGKLLFDHREASAHWDLDKRSDRIKALREAYGPAAVWMDLEAIADYWDDPQATHAEFKRYWLNQPIPLEGPAESALPNWSRWVDRSSAPDDPVAFGIDVPPDRSSACISATGARADGLYHVGMVPATKGGVEISGVGTGWVVDRVVQLRDDWQPCSVVIDGRSAAASLIPKLEERGVEVTVTNSTDYARACGSFFDAVQEGKLRHQGEPGLSAAVEGAATRPLGEGIAWDRRDHRDISQLVAATLALHGFVTRTNQPFFASWR